MAQETVVQEFTFNVSDASFLACMKFAANQAGKPYGIMEICGLALCEIALVLNKKINNPFKDSGQTWICDQLIAALLETCENVSLPMPLDDMTPKDVFALVSGLPATLSTDAA